MTRIERDARVYWSASRELMHPHQHPAIREYVGAILGALSRRAPAPVAGRAWRRLRGTAAVRSGELSDGGAA